MKVIDEWKPIKDFCGYYINRNGEINSTNAFKGTKEIILKCSVSNKGYKIVNLMNCGKVYSRTIHKLLAQAFIPNPDNLSCINHKDGNKLNNSLDNLEWCNAKYNTNYGTGIERRSISQGKKVRCIETGIIYDSIAEAERATGIPHSSIGLVCRGKYSQTHNTHWEYV